MKLLGQIQKNGILLLCGIILLVLIIFPVVAIFERAVILDGRLDLSKAIITISANENFTTIRNSLLLGFVVVLFSTFLASPLAFILSRTEFAKYKWMDIAIMVPFMTPPFISSMGWILFMQKNGLMQQLFPFTGRLSETFFSFWGLAFIMALHLYPFLVMILKNALLHISSNLEEAGAVFGGSFWYRIRKIIIPLLTGNFAIGALLVFVKTISEYGTPYTLGTRIGFRVFTTDIHRYSTTSPIDFGKAASLSSVLIAICLTIWYMQNYITHKKSYQTVSGKGIKITFKKLNFSTKLFVWIYICLLLIVSIGIPYFSIISTSLIKLRGFGLAFGNFTIQHYIDLFTLNTKGIHAIFTSLILATSAASIASILGTTVVIAVRYSYLKLKKVIEVISILPEMLPSIVIVIGIMLFWNKIYLYIPLYNTLGILIITYVVLYLPHTIQYVSSSFTQINDNLIQAGRVFGASKLYIYTKITLPLVLKGIVTGWIMTFIISFRELVAASMMAPPNTLTISTFIVREFEQGSVAIGMAMAVIYVILTTGILLILNTILIKKEV